MARHCRRGVVVDLRSALGSTNRSVLLDVPLGIFYPVLWKNVPTCKKYSQSKNGEILSQCGFSHWHDTCYYLGECLTEIDGFQVLSERYPSIPIMHIHKEVLYVP